MKNKKIFFKVILLYLLITYGYSMPFRVNLSEEFDIKKGEKVLIKGTKLIVTFDGAGYDHGTDNNMGYNVILYAQIDNKEKVRLFIETINGKPGKAYIEGYIIHLLFSNGKDLCRLKIERRVR